MPELREHAASRGVWDQVLISDAHEWINDDSHCPYLLSGETTVKGTGLTQSAGKEDPVELDSIQTW